MATKYIKSDLQSLRKLYTHLQSLKTGSQSGSPQYLDESAQIFLRSLLDDACERAFEAHSEIMAARFDMSSETSPRVAHLLTCNSVTADDGEHKPLKPKSLVLVSDNLNPESFNPTPAKKRKYCDISQENSIEQFKSREANRDVPEKDPNLCPYNCSENYQQTYESFDHNFVGNEEMIDQNKLGENVGKTMSNCLTTNLKENQVANTESKELFKKKLGEKIESMSQSYQISSHGFRYIRGIRIPASPSNIASGTPPLPGQIEKKFQNLNLRPQKELNVRTSQSSPFLYEDSEYSCRDSEEYSLSDTQSSDNFELTSYHDSDSDSFYSQTSSYEDRSISSGDNVVDEDSESNSEGSFKGKFGNPIKVKKQIGRLRKLKEKLGLIFHHHHHHHVTATRGRSLWKNVAKIFHKRGRTKKHGRKAVEKDARSLIPKVPNKNQNGHFYDLIKVIRKNVKNSRSPRLSKGDTKKGAQKLQWWQMLKQQRAVKAMVPSKPKVKVGLGTKMTNKPHLRALPMLTSDASEG